MTRPPGSDSERTERLPLASLRAASDGEQHLRATLTMLKGPAVGAVYPIEAGTTLIGRAQEANIQVAAEGISRRHAEIIERDGKYVLTDLGSTNGTICRGTLLDEPIELIDGDRLNLGGRVIFRFAREGALEEALRQRVYTLATRDPLTNAYNRRYFEERLNSEWAWAVRHRTNLALLFVDVDHFKVVNDTHGHPAGDVVLGGIVDVLAETLRREDLVARLGGEEFAVLCRATDLTAAVGLADRLRRRVEEATFNYRSTALNVTISVGVATSAEGAVTDPETLIARADERLYVAKSAGRNRVEPVPGSGQ